MYNAIKLLYNPIIIKGKRTEEMKENGRKQQDFGSGYYETKKHSDTMFAYNVYPCTIPGDFTFVPLHWQDSMEIIL